MFAQFSTQSLEDRIKPHVTFFEHLGLSKEEIAKLIDVDPSKLLCEAAQIYNFDHIMQKLDV